MFRTLLSVSLLALGAAGASAQDYYYPSAYGGPVGGCAACGEGCGWAPYCGPSGYSQLSCLWDGYQQRHCGLRACYQHVGGCEGCHQPLGCGHLAPSACCGDELAEYGEASEVIVEESVMPEAALADEPQVEPSPAEEGAASPSDEPQA